MAELEDTSLLEKIWQPLFDAKDRPLLRLGQFLRGIAVYLTTDEHEVVVTPKKMHEFYEATGTGSDYCWEAIFGGRTSNAALSRLYCLLACEHHLVQAGNEKTPTIPALTPLGFATWIGHAVHANPTLEHRRLAMAVRNMPISNADDRCERFPKELPRSLFPANPDERIRRLFLRALDAEGRLACHSRSPPASARRTPVKKYSSPELRGDKTGLSGRERSGSLPGRPPLASCLRRRPRSPSEPLRNASTQSAPEASDNSPPRGYAYSSHARATSENIPRSFQCNDPSLNGEDGNVLRSTCSNDYGQATPKKGVRFQDNFTAFESLPRHRPV